MHADAVDGSRAGASPGGWAGLLGRHRRQVGRRAQPAHGSGRRQPAHRPHPPQCARPEELWMPQHRILRAMEAHDGVLSATRRHNHAGARWGSTAGRAGSRGASSKRIAGLCDKDQRAHRAPRGASSLRRANGDSLEAPPATTKWHPRWGGDPGHLSTRGWSTPRRDFRARRTRPDASRVLDRARRAGS